MAVLYLFISNLHSSNSFLLFLLSFIILIIAIGNKNTKQIQGNSFSKNAITTPTASKTESTFFKIFSLEEREKELLFLNALLSDRLTLAQRKPWQTGLSVVLTGT